MIRQKINILFLLAVILSDRLNSQVQAPTDNTGSNDLTINWLRSRVYDAGGNVIADRKNFFDNGGELLQSQIKLKYKLSNGTVVTHVFAGQPLYDVMGRPVGQTMSAPIDASQFIYKADFVRNSSGGTYDFRNFDRYNPGTGENDKTNNPDAIGTISQKGTLGWYYSSNNNWETFMPTSSYPYSRQTLYADGTGNSKKSAGAGEVYRMGQGHEGSGYIYPSIGEFTNYIQVRNKFFSSAEVGELPAHLGNGASILIVSKDANGNQVFSMIDRDGHLLMTARPGNDITLNCSAGIFSDERYQYGVDGDDILYITPSAYIDVYTGSTSSPSLFYSGLVSGFNQSSLGTTNGRVFSTEKFYVQTCTAGTCNPKVYALPAPRIHYFRIMSDNIAVAILTNGTYTLYDMETEQPITFNGSSLNKGYYKLVANTGNATIQYRNNYTDISYNFYNQLGQLVASIAPEGVKKLIQNINAYATKNDVPFITLYEYDVQGRMVKLNTPDGGMSEMVYRKDGRIRFSQNAEQRVTGRYSYSNYDQWGRAIESGEYLPDGSGIAFNADLSVSSAMKNILEDVSSTGGLTTGTKKDIIKIKYEEPDATHGQSGYVQDEYFLRSAVSMTEKLGDVVNNNYGAAQKISQTWYNYDDLGNVVWMIQNINGLGYKTVDYTFDADNKVTKVVFQKNTSGETFVYYYEYDVENRLEKVYTNTVDNSSTKTLQAKYVYYLHGSLKRVELASNIQGLDYTYTLDGKLKTVNHSDVTKDPGNDNPGTNGFLQDAFGMNLEYYANDYVRSGSNITSISINSNDAPEQFGGHIRGMSWFSKKPAASGGSDNPTMYAYKYDAKYQFADATWGSISSGNFSSQSGVNKETISSYDLNGNILNLNRTNSSATTIDNFLYNYQQTPKPNNKLASITQQTTSQNYSTYDYDNLGQLKSELPGPANGSSVNKYIQYDVSGKVIAVYSNSAMTIPIVTYVYNELGKRIKKLSYNSSGTLLNTSYYIYSAGGSLISIYDQPNGGNITQKELQIYGEEERIGVYYRSSSTYRYELTDYLGNVRAVFFKTISNGIEMVVYRDYYPFGMVIPGREYTDADGYRYGYQGEYNEKDPETGWNAFEVRMYDSRIGRWLSIDQARQFESPYLAMGNDVINGVDPDGRLMIFVNGFRKGAWTKRNSKAERKRNPKGKLGDPEKIYRHNDVLPYSDTKALDYWEGVDAELAVSWNEKGENLLYVDGTNEPFSRAQTRYNEGIEAANVLYNDIINGKITLAAEETIKIIGHSHGGAYAAGMAYQLNLLYKEGKIKNRVEYLGLLAPAQPNQFDVPDDIFSEQYSRKSDLLTSRGRIARLLGSTFTAAGNITRFYSLPGVAPWKGWGGHYIGWYAKFYRQKRKLVAPVYF